MNQTHFLPPQKIKICQHEGALTLKMDGQKLRLAAPKRALPLTNPDEYIVLLSEDGDEIGVIKALRDLEPASRERLSARLEEIYYVTPILRVLEVDREPLSGRVRWRVEVEAQPGEESLETDEKISPFRLLRRPKTEADDTEPEVPRREVTFFIAGAEDVQTARYPQIFFTDTESNRYEIPNCEALDLASRRMAERFF
jgi:hypothetical protein